MAGYSPMPPPSSGWSFSPPIRANELDVACSHLAGVSPEFALDSTETWQIRQFLVAREASDAKAQWVPGLGLLFVNSPALLGPVVAWVVRPSIIDTPLYLLYVPLAFLFSLVAVFVSRFAIGVLSGSTGSATAGRLVAVAGTVDLILLWLASVLAKVHLANWIAWPLLSGTVAGLLMPVPLIIVLLFSFMAKWRNQADQRQAPEALIAGSLFEVFSHAALGTAAPVGLETRKSWVRSLSNVADYLENGLVRQIASADQILDQKIRGELEKRAAAMREFAGRIALGAGTGLEIATALRGLLRFACYLDWQALPAADTAVRERMHWGSWLRKAARNLTILLLPLGILLALRRGWIVLEPGQQNWANGILLVWIALIVLSLIDPEFEFTSKTLEIVGKVPLFGKGGKRE